MASAENKIRVKRKGIPLSPFSFLFKKKKHVINNILHNWQEYGFDVDVEEEEDKDKRDWSTARRRNYYQVETKDGRVFEIFQDMTDLTREGWFLTKEIVDE